MQKIIQIYPCLFKLSRKQASVTNRQTDGRPLLLFKTPKINHHLHLLNMKLSVVKMPLIFYSGDMET
jgi:hypothetical protein